MKKPKRTRKDFDALLRFLPTFETPGFRFGEMKAHSGHTLPSAHLAPEVREFHQALYDHHWIVPFDWPSWHDEAQSYIDDAQKLESADLETLEKLLTAHARADRFVEGHLLAMFENGHITAILRRLRQLKP